MICDAFLLASKENPNLKFAVAGYSDLESLFINGKYSNTPIEFLGKLSSSDVSELFQSSKFFISMNSLEPFGIVFAEALMNGCNVITESTAGCASTFIKNDFFHIADCSNSDTLKNCILNIYPNYVDISKESRERLAQEMSLKKMAEEYRKLAFLKNK